MREIIRFVKRLFGKYDTGYEYWVNLKDIQITPEFRSTYPRHKKMIQKWNYYRETGEFESPIVLMRNFTLVNGYTSYLIAEKQGLDKVPVYFVD